MKSMADRFKPIYFDLAVRRPGRWPIGLGLICAAVVSLAMWWGIVRAAFLVSSLPSFS